MFNEVKLKNSLDILQGINWMFGMLKSPQRINLTEGKFIKKEFNKSKNASYSEIGLEGEI